MMDTRRALSFTMRLRMLNAEQFDDARQILRDIDSLDSHTAFLFDKINFLMDATVGFINISQNKIIKIFSVASVAMLPPTLVASIYGMNLQFPEFALLGNYAYPYVVGVMFLSAVLPMWFCYKRGWLR
jgi:magnesium transporter